MELLFLLIFIHRTEVRRYNMYRSYGAYFGCYVEGGALSPPGCWLFPLEIGHSVLDIGYSPARLDPANAGRIIGYSILNLIAIEP